jgi:hypothetical protein
MIRGEMASGFQIISFADSDTHAREYKRRRPHQKTRSGCVACKIKRVKVGSHMQPF